MISYFYKEGKIFAENLSFMNFPKPSYNDNNLKPVWASTVILEAQCQENHSKWEQWGNQDIFRHFDNTIKGAISYSYLAFPF